MVTKNWEYPEPTLQEKATIIGKRLDVLGSEESFDPGQFLQYEILEITSKQTPRSGEFTELEILLTYGGPTVWIDLVAGTLLAHHQGETRSHKLSRKFLNKLWTFITGQEEWGGE